MHILNMVGAGGGGSGGGQMRTGTYTLKNGMLTVRNLPFRPLIAIAWPNTSFAPSGQFAEAYADDGASTGYNGRRLTAGAGSPVNWESISSTCSFDNGTFQMKVAGSTSTAAARYYLAG